MGVKLVSSGGGSVEINPPATASSFTATMPAGTGTVAVNGVSGTLVSGTAVASTSGTSIDFTGIPSWVKRITVMFNGVSTNGTSLIQLQLGSTTFTTSGYISASGSSDSSGTSTSTTGIAIRSGIATNLLTGAFVISNTSSNIWNATLNMYRSDGSAVYGAGGVTLSGTLDRVRITTVNGTDTFDAGSINIMYE